MKTFISHDPITPNSLQQVQDWVQLTHDAMIAVGCIQTLDTGQIEIDDIEPPATGVAATFGYRIYELNDDLSNENPIYIKITFKSIRISSSSGIYPSPCTNIQVGFNTDGSGNILAPMAVNRDTYIGYASSTTSVTRNEAPLSIVIKDQGYLVIGIGMGCAWQSANSCATATFLILKRSRDQNGDYDGKGFIALFPNISFYGFAEKGSLEYQWAGRNPSYLGPIQISCLSLPRTPSIDGLIQANAADLSGWNYSLIDTDIVALHNSSVIRESIITLSTDGIEEKKYFVLPLRTGTTGSIDTGLNIDVDTRQRNEGTIAVRFE